MGQTSRVKQAKPAVAVRIVQRDFEEALHWDVSDEGRRLFTVRGEQGRIHVTDWRTPEKDLASFRSAEGALAWIMEELVHEARTP